MIQTVMEQSPLKLKLEENNLQKEKTKKARHGEPFLLPLILLVATSQKDHHIIQQGGQCT